MKRRLRFNSADALWALTLAAAWCAYAFSNRNRTHDSDGELIFNMVVMIAVPGAAAGALLGHRWVGLVCGLASALAAAAAMVLGG